jgi:hypothetical protein
LPEGIEENLKPSTRIAGIKVEISIKQFPNTGQKYYYCTKPAGALLLDR